MDLIKTQVEASGISKFILKFSIISLERHLLNIHLNQLFSKDLNSDCATVIVFQFVEYKRWIF